MSENVFLFYTIERHRIQARDVCVVRVKPATAPVYLDKHLYVRSNAQTIEMMGPDLVNYVATRWFQIPAPSPTKPRAKPRAATSKKANK